ncbi:MAG TPA: alpha/beta hydrolase [Burkholderiales bacterium]|nr:alpha/beta hydrolase [Burkholderiales bacterium]
MVPFVPAADIAAQDRSCTGFDRTLRMRVHRRGSGRSTPPALVYFHPGRFVSGGLEEADAAARALAERYGVAVITPAYSLAVECPFPAAAEDAYTALRWVHDNAGAGLWSAKRIAVIGHEAGGNLAAVAAMMARDRGGPHVVAQVLLSPMLDPSLTSCSMRQAEEASRACGEAYHRYLPNTADRLHPYAAPGLCTRLAQLPPALILTADDDPLRDEAQHYGAKLDAAGVHTRVARLDKAGWSAAAWREIGDFLEPLLAPARGTPLHT